MCRCYWLSKNSISPHYDSNCELVFILSQEQGAYVPGSDRLCRVLNGGKIPPYLTRPADGYFGGPPCCPVFDSMATGKLGKYPHSGTTILIPALHIREIQQHSCLVWLSNRGNHHHEDRATGLPEGGDLHMNKPTISRPVVLSNSASLCAMSPQK